MKNLYVYLLVAVLSFGCGKADVKNGRVMEICGKSNLHEDNDNEEVGSNNNDNDKTDDEESGEKTKIDFYKQVFEKYKLKNSYYNAVFNYFDLECRTQNDQVRKYYFEPEKFLYGIQKNGKGFKFTRIMNYVALLDVEGEKIFLKTVNYDQAYPTIKLHELGLSKGIKICPTILGVASYETDDRNDDHIDSILLIEKGESSIDGAFLNTIDVINIFKKLKFIYDEGFIHTDVSPNNIIFDRETKEPLFIDFSNKIYAFKGYSVENGIAESIRALYDPITRNFSVSRALCISVLFHKYKYKHNQSGDTFGEWIRYNHLEKTLGGAQLDKIDNILLDGAKNNKYSISEMIEKLESPSLQT